ncbi:MAG: IS1634 family transposase, partial [Bacillota bacterium]|nr:IS1634 family transposase [Bacillota bacterium]
TFCVCITIIWFFSEFHQFFQLVFEFILFIGVKIVRGFIGFFLMVVQHLLQPRSKLTTYNHQTHFVNLPKVSLNQLYRSLDLLCEYKEQLEEALFQANRNLFNMQINMVFYDVTTFSFESVRADSLMDFGFSKNGKFKEVQVVMGLMIDCEGRPIGYELFPGNTFDGKTLDRALAALKERFDIRRRLQVSCGFEPCQLINSGKIYLYEEDIR